MRRVKKMELRVSVLESALLKEINLVEDLKERLTKLEQAEPTQGEWLQAGIDSIMGYEWPPKRGEGE